MARQSDLNQVPLLVDAASVAVPATDLVFPMKGRNRCYRVVLRRRGHSKANGKTIFNHKSRWNPYCRKTLEGTVPPRKWLDIQREPTVDCQQRGLGK